MTEYPQWVHDLVEDPECHDTEWGRSCHFCGSGRGEYNGPLLHYANCLWLAACATIGVEIDPTRHGVYEPKPCTPCETCGWWYNSPDDWQGRVMPDPAPPELRLAHDTHIAESHGITVEQYYAGPKNQAGFFPFTDGPMAWHLLWGMYSYSLASVVTPFKAERGGITFINPPVIDCE